MSTAVMLEGYDGGRVVGNDPSSPIAIQSLLATDKYDGISDALNDDWRPPSRRGDITDEKMDSVYDEAPIRYHARYIAPEALVSKSSFGTLMDVYSFGVLAHELITGQRRYDGMHPSMDLLAVLNMHRTMPLARLQEIRPSTPLELCEIVAKCLRIDFDERYVNFRSLLHDLRSVRALLRGGADADAAFKVGEVDRVSRFSLARADTLFEREAHLHALDKVYHEVKTDGSVKVVCVWGASGSGKSHLVDTWARGRDGTGKDRECFVAMAKVRSLGCRNGFHIDVGLTTVAFGGGVRRWINISSSRSQAWCKSLRASCQPSSAIQARITANGEPRSETSSTHRRESSLG
jgi:hypothetical protein